ncbi:MAG: IS66 family transposase [Gallionellaceae bacterium]|nr:IS66 family transposase [Gallionellaceae bacterium]
MSVDIKNLPKLKPNFTLPEVTLPAKLPSDIAALTALFLSQQDAHQQNLVKAMAHIEFLYEQIVLMRHRQFGASSEVASSQGLLFDEAEVLAVSSTPEQDLAEIPAVFIPKPARGKRAPLSESLPRIDIIHDVPESQRQCCGVLMVEIDQEISEQLDIVPMQIRVLRHIRKRYGCLSSTHAPVIAALPPQPRPKSNASPDLLAMLLTVKYVDGLPLARFEHVLARHGVPVARQTLARWVIGCANLLQPLHNLIRDTLLEGAFIHMDETVVQVLKEKDKKPTSNSYMWVQAGGLPNKPVVIFDYDPSRSGAVPARLLQDYHGHLMTDGYEGYNQVVKTQGITHLVCWAHVRRRFVDAVKVQAKGQRGHTDTFVALIGKLYAIERDCKTASDEVRLLARQTRARALLDELHDWMERVIPTVTPKSALGTALAYLQKYWPRLIGYLLRGDLPIDNNRAENSIRPFVVGRKGWLFSDTPAGANASAIIYSLVETVKANGLEPYLWLSQVLRELPAAQTVEAVEALLPWNMPTKHSIR